MPDIVPENPDSRKPVSLHPKTFCWKHPDPRLAKSIASASAIGMPISRMATIFNTDERLLKLYYDLELTNGRDMLAYTLAERAIEMAYNDGNEKMMKYALDKFCGFGDKAKKKTAEAVDEKDSELEKKGLDLSKLSVDEIRHLRDLMDKARPSIVVEATRKEG